MLGLICHVSALLALFWTTQAHSDVPDPIAFYPLNSKYETREINNRQPQGTPVGVSLAPGPDDKPGGSYQFTGNANSYIEFPNNGGLDVKHSNTLLCWVYLTRTDDGPLFQYDPNTAKWGTHFWIVQGKLFIRYNKINYQETDTLFSDDLLELNKWHYVGSSYDSNTGIARLWLNGQQVGQLNIGAGLTLATQDKVRMGARSYDSRYFKGRIASMQVYNVALTAEQISEVKNKGRDLTTHSDVPDPIAFYPLNSKYETREINNRQPQGTPVGVSLAPGPHDMPGGSYQFAGNANSYIEFPNNGGLDVQHSNTMLCWVYLTRTDDGPLFQYDPNTAKWGTHFWIVQGKLFIRYNKINYQETDTLFSDDLLELNKWHYVGSSYDSNTGIARLWLNGQQVGQLNIGAGLTLATQDKVRMGARSYDSRYFKGRIAAMQVYNVALTAEQISEVKNKGRVDICEEQKPCKNGAKCESSSDSYICKCVEGFQGATCESDVDECQTLDPCQNGAECNNTFGSYTCTCKLGFTGENCQTDIDECSAQSVVCYNGGTCVHQVNSYTCDCQAGYIGDHCAWEERGCYKEEKNNKEKAMGRVYASFRMYQTKIQDAVLACLKAAEKNMLQVFGVKNRYKCTTTKGAAKFDRHGVSKGCKNERNYGVGVKRANFVYTLKKEQ